MRLRMPMVLLITLMMAGTVRAQSVAPENRYVLKAGAGYITGYPYVPRTAKGEPRHAKGDIYIGIDALHFRFCAESQDGGPDPFAEGLASPADKTGCGGLCGGNLCQEVRIPYDRMKLLSRGRAVGMGGTSEDIQVASAGLGIAGLIGGISTGGTLQKGLIGATIGAAAVGFGIHEYSLKRANYMTIFFAPAHQTDPTLPCHGASAPPAAAPSADSSAGGAAGKEPQKPPASPPPGPLNPFADAKGCDVAIFQIFNSHQYWNISMILNARTGKEFVSQGAELK
jgi:hypothetical protein